MLSALLALGWIAAVAVPRSWADASLLVEEPFGRFGGMNPTGHAALYFDRICADSPTHLRLCRPGELGVVISRYHKIDGYDWLAMPILPYLYAVDRAEDVPESVTPATAAEFRDRYRRRHLLALAPSTPAGDAPEGEWIQLVGSSFDRTIHGFTVHTTVEQDARVIALLNDRRNVSHFNLFFNNCADLARVLLNLDYPHLIHRNYVADVSFTTPKQEARLLVHYGRRHPEMELRTFVIPQLPGTMERSTKVRGVLESLVKSKRYLVPLGYFFPQVTGGMAVAYLGAGRFRFPTDGTVWDAATLTSSAAMTENKVKTIATMDTRSAIPLVPELQLEEADPVLADSDAAELVYGDPEPAF